MTRWIAPGSGLPPPPAMMAYSRPPMKRPEAMGRPNASTLASVSSRGSSWSSERPTLIRITQVPVDSTVNGAWRETSEGGDFRLDRTERIEGAAQRWQQVVDVESSDEARGLSLPRRPEISMGAERGDFRDRDAAHAPGPILRIANEISRLGEELRAAPLLIGQLTTKIEAGGDFW